MQKPRTIPELIEAFGGPTGFAKVIDKNPSTASEMKRSESVRVSYWPRIVDAARERGIPGVSLETIAKMHISTPSHEGAAS
jgi:hypothetical protein